VLAGSVTGLGVLARQPVGVLWLGVACVYLWALLAGRVRRTLIAPLRIFSLAPAALPYFVNVGRLGHVATDQGTSVMGRVFDSITSGTGPMAIANSTTLPWAIVFAVALVASLLTLRWGALVLLLTVPGYLVYYSIWSYLWGLGRYQAEYVTPFIALSLAAAAPLVRKPATRIVAAALLGVLCLGSLQVHRDLNQDINYREWPRMRITTTAYLPYDEALGYLVREESHGQFAILGGMPWYGDFALWQAGFDFDAVRRWRTAQRALGGMLPQVRSVEELAAACRRAHVAYLVVQGGRKRERQHRIEPVQRSIALLERPHIASFVREMTFSDRFGGIMDIDRVGHDRE
jgi:hypothetical protein